MEWTGKKYGQYLGMVDDLYWGACRWRRAWLDIMDYPEEWQVQRLGAESVGPKSLPSKR